MNSLRTLIFALLTVAIAIPAQARKKNNAPEMLTLYVFGVSQNLTDSIVYITDITSVAGATLLPHEQLENQLYYSEQLKKHIEGNYGVGHQTAAVFYARDSKKAQKLLNRTREKLKKNTRYQPIYELITQDEFHFKVPLIKIAED